LAPLHQKRRVVLVALFVDNQQRCLMIRGFLPQEEHECLGTNKCALPFVERTLRAIPQLGRSRVRSVVRAYDVNPTIYMVVRIDVFEPTAVVDGEWVASAGRVIELSGEALQVRIIQRYLGENPVWRSFPKEARLEAA